MKRRSRQFFSTNGRPEPSGFFSIRGAASEHSTDLFSMADVGGQA
jgi:hypothetical protein